MGRTVIRVFAVSLLVVLLSLSEVWATSQAAMLVVSGSVSVNGVSDSRTSTLQPGDAIKTGPTSSATIMLTGSTVVIPPASAVEFDGSAVRLIAGKMQVNTASGMTARVAGFSVKPVSPQSCFHLARAEGYFVIKALKSSVVLSDGKDSKIVEEGRTVQVLENERKKERGGIILVPIDIGAADALNAEAFGASVFAMGSALVLLTGSPISPAVP